MMAVCQSVHADRKLSASRISQELNKKASIRSLLDAQIVLSDNLQKLCDLEVEKGKSEADINQIYPQILETIRKFSGKIMVPVLSQMVPPSSDAWGFDVTIVDIKSKVKIMHSLQQPKRISFLGSDGKEYPFLIKKDDDIRKDQRIMECVCMINALLSKEPEARRRNLYLRAYAVCPLTENKGILQWVDNLHHFKKAVDASYGSLLVMEQRTWHEKWRTFKATANNQVRIQEMGPFFETALNRYPPSLHKWWFANFPDPATWLQARTTFTRTTAVWAMVGHIVGLGDRHGENILIDEISGDAVHVDFNCIFDKALTLPVPELVPFRLTQNIIDVFGVSGVEGVFRRCSCETLKVLRAHKDSLVSVIETIVDDPFVDLQVGQKFSSRRSGKSGSSSKNETRLAVKDALSIVKGRLVGSLYSVKSMPCLPMSVDGQVDMLIKEATDKNNLCLMFIGWMPWY